MRPLLLLAAVLATLGGSWLFVSRSHAHSLVDNVRNPASRPLVALPDKCLAVFQGDGLGDLARLLVGAAQPSQSGGPVLIDLAYAGGGAHDADFIGLWMLAPDADFNVLPPLQNVLSYPELSALAGTLQAGRLHNKTFALTKLHGTWLPWNFTLTSSTIGIEARGADAQRLQSELASQAGPFVTFSTKNVDFPLGFDKTTKTSWVPFFDVGRVTFRLQHDMVFSDDTTPDVSALAQHSGYIAGDDYLNYIFVNDLQDRQWPVSFNNTSYHLTHAKISDSGGFLRLTVDVKEMVGAHLSARLQGPDLSVLDVSASVDATVPNATVLQTTMNGIADALTLQLQTQGTTIRPKGFVPLGIFHIGTLLMNGGMLVTSIRPGDHALAVQGSSRLVSGDIQ